MNFFAEALSDAINRSNYKLADLAKAAGISSHSVISRLKNGELSCSRTNLEALLNAFEGWPQLQLNLIAARCKEVVPDRWQYLFDELHLYVAEDQAAYSVEGSMLEKQIDRLKEKARFNEDLRSTLLFLASVTD